MQSILAYVLDKKMLKKCIFSKSVDKNILKVTGRLIEIKNEVYLALESFLVNGKTIQKNIPINVAVEEILKIFPSDFKQLNIITNSGDAEIKVSKKNKILISNKIKKSEDCTVDLSHNRKKQYILPDNEKVDFLYLLGVQDSLGKLIDKKRSKFRQINRFLEIVKDVENEIIDKDSNNLYILDLCCGKSYLSFAIYYYFSKIKNYNVIMDCVDLKEDVIDYCNKVKDSLNYGGLNFICKDVLEFEVRKTPNLTVSLHACDIATDIVIKKAIQNNSKVILSTPCCHHQLMWQLKKKGGIFDFILENSILKQKFCDALTDSLRCKYLQINNYDTEAIELIDPEETPKNVLIRAIKRSNLKKEQINKLKEEYQAITEFLGVNPYLNI